MVEARITATVTGMEIATVMGTATATEQLAMATATAMTTATSMVMRMKP
jgi:hypothetical protein